MAGRSRSPLHERLGNVQEPLCVNAPAKEKDRPSKRGPFTAIERFFDADDELAIRGRAECLGLALKVLARVVADDLDEDTMGAARECEVGEEKAMARADDLRLPRNLLSVCLKSASGPDASMRSPPLSATAKVASKPRSLA